MRRAKDLLVRFLLTLALIVAALPLRAGAAHCAAPVVQAQSAACPMPCCAVKPKTEAARNCCQTKAKGFHREIGSICACQIDSAPPARLPAASIVPSSFDAPILLVAEPSPTLTSPVLLPDFTPGITGVDSGPPKDVFQRRSPSRAPPVARA